MYLNTTNHLIHIGPVLTLVPWEPQEIPSNWLKCRDVQKLIRLGHLRLVTEPSPEAAIAACESKEDLMAFIKGREDDKVLVASVLRRLKEL